MVNDVEVMRKLETWGNSDEVNSSILNYLGFVDRGPDNIVMNPMLPDDLQKVSELYEAALVNEDEWMRDFSNSEREKFKPRSAYPGFQEYHDKAKQQWNNQPDWDSSSPYRGKAVDLVVRYLGARRSLRAISLQNAVYRLKRNTNSGSFGFTRRGKILDNPESLSAMLERTREVYHGLVAPGQYILATRAKEGRGETETSARLVYMGPIHETLLCATIQTPLQQWLTKIPSFPSMSGPIQDDKALAYIMGNTGGHPILSGDISNFDSSVHVNKLEEAEYVYNQLFQPSERELIFRCFECCRDGGVLTPLGWWPSTGHGVKSGWTQTNQVDSIVNLIDQTTNFLTLGVNILDGNFPFPIINGDDFVVNTRGVSVDELSSVSKTHGMEMHPDKQLVSDVVGAFNARYMKRGDSHSVRPGWRHARADAFPETDPHLDAPGWSLRGIAILGLVTSNRAYMDLLKLMIQLDRKYALGTSSRTSLDLILSEENVKKVSEAMGWDDKDEPSSARYGPGTYDIVVRDIISLSGL